MSVFPGFRNLFIGHLLVTGAMLIVFSAPPSAGAQESRSCGKYGGVLSTHAGEDLVSFDFHQQTTVRTQQRVGGSYNRLFRFSFFEKRQGRARPGEVLPGG